jgi:3D (Asp-Asp-Asp) domain-containing protein
MTRNILGTLFMLSLGLASCASAGTYHVTTTGYSLSGTTATGKRSRPGHVALSRDLLKSIPYGSLVKITSVKGSNCGGYKTATLIVEDTMARSKYKTVDIRLGSYAKAIEWGRCNSVMQVIRYGRG